MTSHPHLYDLSLLADDRAHSALNGVAASTEIGSSSYPPKVADVKWILKEIRETCTYQNAKSSAASKLHGTGPMNGVFKDGWEALEKWLMDVAPGLELTPENDSQKATITLEQFELLWDEIVGGNRNGDRARMIKRLFGKPASATTAVSKPKPRKAFTPCIACGPTFIGKCIHRPALAPPLLEFEIITYPTIISSYALFDYCSKRYPNRKVTASAMIDHDDFIYWSRTGKQRMIKRKNEVWVLGKEWPMIERVR